VDSRGRTIFVADAHRGDGKRYIVRADEKLTAFVELESAIRLWGYIALIFGLFMDELKTAAWRFSILAAFFYRYANYFGASIFPSRYIL
jgi:hypothetical protein